MGDNDRIHGYNIQYRADEGRFHSFGLTPQNRPTNFVLQQVEGAAQGTTDHQGHIVPQNILASVLAPLSAAMAAGIAVHENSLEGLTAWIDTVEDAWSVQVFREVVHYGTENHMPMFDFESNDADTKFNGFFSIIMWNPVNICRAPADATRGGNPGNEIDGEVLHQVRITMPAIVVEALDALVGAENDANKKAFVAACCSTLIGQLANGVGYYQFPWHLVEGVLHPALWIK